MADLAQNFPVKGQSHKEQAPIGKLTSFLPALVLRMGAIEGKISHGDREFHPCRENIEDPNSHWLAKVPVEAAVHFCRVGSCEVLRE